MISRQMKEAEKGKRQNFYYFEGQVSGELSKDKSGYLLEGNNGIDYRFLSDLCVDKLTTITKKDTFVKKRKKLSFTVIKEDGTQFNCFYMSGNIR